MGRFPYDMEFQRLTDMAGDEMVSFLLRRRRGLH